MGTSVGTIVFLQHGWRACAVLLQAWQGFQLAVLFLRGPHCPRKYWFGYAGGWAAGKQVVDGERVDDSIQEQSETPTEGESGKVRSGGGIRKS